MYLSILPLSLPQSYLRFFSAEYHDFFYFMVLQTFLKSVGGRQKPPNQIDKVAFHCCAQATSISRISNLLDHFLLWFGVSPLSRLLTALMRAAAATTQKRTQKGVRTTECLFPSFHNLTCRMERLRGKIFKYSR